MRAMLFSASRRWGPCAVCLLCVAYAAQAGVPGGRFPTPPQDQSKSQEKPKVSGDEQKAAQKVAQAADPAAKLKAAGDFVRKYPKSALRAEVLGHVTQQVNAVGDSAQKIALAESYLAQFTDAADAAAMNSVLLGAYIGAQRFDDAFRVGAAWLAKNPEDVVVLTDLAFQGIEQAQRQNTKFAAQSQTYGLKAIEVLEADRKPAQLSDEDWTRLKKTRLPLLYRALGLLSIMQQNPREAETRLEKALALDPSDPAVYWLMSNIKNEEYQKTAELYQRTPAGANRDELLKIISTQLDEIIDLYAHAIALSEGRAEFQPIREQMLKDIEGYYKYRHKSTEGMQQLIEKYKPKP